MCVVPRILFGSVNSHNHVSQQISGDDFLYKPSMLGVQIIAIYTLRITFSLFITYLCVVEKTIDRGLSDIHLLRGVILRRVGPGRRCE